MTKGRKKNTLFFLSALLTLCGTGHIEASSCAEVTRDVIDCKVCSHCCGRENAARISAVCMYTTVGIQAVRTFETADSSTDLVLAGIELTTATCAIATQSYATKPRPTDSVSTGARPTDSVP